MSEPGSETLEAPPYRTIETERLRLRTFGLDDSEAMLPIISRPEVMQWTSAAPVTNLDQARRWVSARALGPDVFNFVIQLKGLASADPTAQSKIIGVVGSFHWPMVGYLLHPDHFGKGYATEALRAFVPAMWDKMPSASEGGTGFDYLEGGIIRDNRGSQRVLEKAGFTLCETRVGDFENPMRGLCDSMFYRIARPGRTLEELGMGPVDGDGDADSPPVPPVQ
ncbi:hypothetical protein LTR53_014433 [Teratosphaeriaceae sp. CCFEE 6253]|nr:hypothetical protein LTR53_014433 [Teratosphaeriaceae sp. CCFEE 6253]